MSKNITFVIGGSRSGKSRFAESLARQQPLPVVYVSTWLTDFSDDEMKLRVEAHQLRRPPEWKTVEERLDLRNVFEEHQDSFILLDSLTLWVSAKMHDETPIVDLESALENMNAGVIVSDEVGCGIIPENKDTRRYRDMLGTANQVVAEMSNEVYWVVAGIAKKIKP